MKKAIGFSADGVLYTIRANGNAKTGTPTIYSVPEQMDDVVKALQRAKDAGCEVFISTTMSKEYLDAYLKHVPEFRELVDVIKTRENRYELEGNPFFGSDIQDTPAAKAAAMPYDKILFFGTYLDGADSDISKLLEDYEVKKDITFYNGAYCGLTGYCSMMGSSISREIFSDSEYLKVIKAYEEGMNHSPFAESIISSIDEFSSSNSFEQGAKMEKAPDDVSDMLKTAGRLQDEAYNTYKKVISTHDKTNSNEFCEYLSEIADRTSSGKPVIVLQPGETISGIYEKFEQEKALGKTADTDKDIEKLVDGVAAEVKNNGNERVVEDNGEGLDQDK